MISKKQSPAEHVVFQIVSDCLFIPLPSSSPSCRRKNVSTARWICRSLPTASGLPRCPPRHGQLASTWCSPKVPRSERESVRSASTGGLKRGKKSGVQKENHKIHWGIMGNHIGPVSFHMDSTWLMTRDQLGPSTPFPCSY